MLDVSERMLDTHLSLSHQHLCIRLTIACLQLFADSFRKWSLHSPSLCCLRASPESWAASASGRIADLINTGFVVLMVADILQFVALLAAINVGIGIVSEVISKIRVAYDRPHHVHTLIKHDLQIFPAREAGISASLLTDFA